MALLPTRVWIANLMDERVVPPHIRRHCCMVREVAVAAAAALNDRGERLDLGLIEAGALLHDICKYDSILSGGDHARMGADLLIARGYPEVAAIIGQHVRLESFAISAALVVNYADKRVMHDRVVSLDERFSDLMQRYGSDELRRGRIRELYADGQRAEDLICGAAGIEPQTLNRLSLVPADYALYGGGGVGREHGSVEEHDQDE